MLMNAISNEVKNVSANEVVSSHVSDSANPKSPFTDAEVALILPYKTKILEYWNKSRDSIIEVGHQLNNAKFDKSISKEMYQHLVEVECGFSIGTADKLIAVAKSHRITSSQYQDSLPISYGTLYEIATMKDDVFESAIKDKVIHPDCLRKDIEQFKKDGSSSSGSNESDYDEKFKLMSVFIDSSEIKNDDEFLKFKNAVSIALKDVSGIRLDFSFLDSYLENQRVKKTKSDLTAVKKILKNEIEKHVSLDSQLTHACKNRKFKVDLDRLLYGSSKKADEQIVHYANTLKQKWKVDWRSFTVGTSIEQKCVGEIPEFNVKIAA